MSYSQEKGHPRLVMQFNRNQQVPKLVSVNEVTRRDTRNKLLHLARSHATQQPNSTYNPQNHHSMKRAEDVAQLQQTLQGERGENEQLRIAVKQLTAQLNKLRDVNEGLISRIKEVEHAYRTLRGELQENHEEDKKRMKHAIYADVEQYIKLTVQKLTFNLKLEKMTPILEDKLDRFMAELMEINAVSVEQTVRKIRRQEQRRNQSRYQTGQKTFTIDRQGDSRAQRYLSDLSNVSREGLPNRQQYASIMQRLVGQKSMSKSYAVAGFGSASQDARLRTVYATTPQKRKRIFD